MNRKQIAKYCMFYCHSWRWVCSREVTGFTAQGSWGRDKHSAKIQKWAAVVGREARWSCWELEGCDGLWDSLCWVMAVVPTHRAVLHLTAHPASCQDLSCTCQGLCWDGIQMIFLIVLERAPVQPHLFGLLGCNSTASCKDLAAVC